MGDEQEAKPCGSSAPCEAVKAVLFDLDGAQHVLDALIHPPPLPLPAATACRLRLPPLV